MREPFWESGYRDAKADTFGRPSTEIEELASILPPSATVLDMGCGEGRNALFLAERGFSVDAFDISPQGVSKLAKVARDRNLRVDAWVADLTEFSFGRSYDWIISHGVLHLVSRADWQRIIEDMKIHTRPGGVNVVAVFTDSLPTPPDLMPFVKGLFREGELAEIYGDWRITISESYVKRDQHPEGISHLHPINKVVAWRSGDLPES